MLVLNLYFLEKEWTKKFYNQETYSLYFKTDKPLNNSFTITFENETPLEFMDLEEVPEEKGKIFKEIFNKEYILTLGSSIKKLEEKILEFSLRENILSSKTAFIGISKDKNNSFEKYKTIFGNKFFVGMNEFLGVEEIEYSEVEDIKEISFKSFLSMAPRELEISNDILLDSAFQEETDETQEVALKQNVDVLWVCPKFSVN